MNDGLTESYHFSLYQKHIDFLDSINENSRSNALQTILNSVINGNEQAQRKNILNHSIQFITYGFFFFMMLFLTDNPYIYIIGLCVGTFLILYGSIGGIRHAISRTNRNR